MNQPYDCDKVAEAVRAAAANIIERMREAYHRHDGQYADEALTFLRNEFGSDVEEFDLREPKRA